MDEMKKVLLENIQAWLKLENEIKHLRKEMKERRDKKKTLTTILVDIMKKNEIDDVALKNEKLLYTKTKTKTPLSKKHLFTSLTAFFKDDGELAKNLAIFVMDSRKVTISENIKRKNIR